MRKISRFSLLASLSIILSCVSCGSNTFNIHSEKQLKGLGDDPSIMCVLNPKYEELSRPNPLTIESDDNYLYHDEKLSNKVNYVLYEEEGIYNTLVGETYYYISNGKVKKVQIENQAPRNLYISNLTNCRDLGGWKINDESFVKQGLIYRTSKLTNDHTYETLIDDKGINTMVNQLGIKTEIDLRYISNGETNERTNSVLGNSIKYVQIPMKSSGNILTLNKALLTDLFSLLGDSNNYPLNFHCSIGTDRTGMVAFLILGLLGVSEEDISRDYMFSNFGAIGGSRTISDIKTYITTVNRSAGSNLKEKINSYLISNNVKQQDIDNMISILS